MKTKKAVARHMSAHINHTYIADGGFTDAESNKSEEQIETQCET